MKNKLLELRKKISLSQNKENKNINNVLKWLRKRNKINKMRVSKIPVNMLKDWHIKENGNLFIFHFSKILVWSGDFKNLRFELMNSPF